MVGIGFSFCVVVGFIVSGMINGLNK